MILKNNGQVIKEYVQMNQATMNYLKRFWKLPDKNEIEKEREKLYTYDKQWVLAKNNVTGNWIKNYEGSIA